MFEAIRDLLPENGNVLDIARNEIPHFIELGGGDLYKTCLLIIFTLKYVIPATNVSMARQLENIMRNIGMQAAPLGISSGNVVANRMANPFDQSPSPQRQHAGIFHQSPVHETSDIGNIQGNDTIAVADEEDDDDMTVNKKNPKKRGMSDEHAEKISHKRVNKPKTRLQTKKERARVNRVIDIDADDIDDDEIEEDEIEEYENDGDDDEKDEIVDSLNDFMTSDRKTEKEVNMDDIRTSHRQHGTEYATKTRIVGVLTAKNLETQVLSKKGLTFADFIASDMYTGNIRKRVVTNISNLGHNGKPTVGFFHDQLLYVLERGTCIEERNIHIKKWTCSCCFTTKEIKYAWKIINNNKTTVWYLGSDCRARMFEIIKLYAYLHSLLPGKPSYPFIGFPCQPLHAQPETAIQCVNEINLRIDAITSSFAAVVDKYSVSGADGRSSH